MIINDDFIPKRGRSDRLPPGQYEDRGFPVLSLGPTPSVSKEKWQLSIKGEVANALSWNWESFSTLPQEDVIKDIHCVTKWSKFDSKWRGVSFDEIIKLAGVKESATYLIAHSYDGYSTNIPLADVTGGKAWLAIAYDSGDIPAEHGGPARLLIPHLYFWKSAKWINELEFADHDKPGFWEIRGYHNYGDPWKEQRYTYD